ncbi:MAG: hypothetical protein ABW199_01220 [Caulobacterales bacterium]
MSGDRIKAERLMHSIHAVKDITAARQLYMRAFAGLAFSEGYHEGEDRDMNLIYVADHMVEPMAPRDVNAADRTFARFLQRYGESFHSIEFKVANSPAAAQRCKDLGVALTTEYDIFFFVHPKSTGGIILEATEVFMFNDPADLPSWNPDWMKGHPSHIRKLAYVACTTKDMDASLRVFTEVFDGEILGEDRVTWPQAARRVMVTVGGTKIALYAPEGEGALAAYQQGPSSGVYALCWESDDLAATEKWFGRFDLKLESKNPKRFSLDPAGVFGARHWFVDRAPF